MANALFPSDADIYIQDADIAGSSLASSDIINATVTNINVSGGTKDTESIPVFGGGNITKENPREQYEVSIECIIQSDKPLLFDQYIMSSTGNIDGTTDTDLDSSNEPTAKSIYVVAKDGTTVERVQAFNNAIATTWEPEFAADEYLKGTITFKIEPTTSDGSANMKVRDALADVSW